MNSLSNTVSRFNEKCIFFFNSSKELSLIVRSGKAQNSGYPKRQTVYVVKAVHGRDFHSLADHITKL